MRKRLLTLTHLVVVCVAGSAEPLLAQQPDGIHRAITREAIRIAADAPTWTSQPPGGRPDSDWSRVRTLASGKEIVVARRGKTAGKLTLLQSDDTGITVVNMAGIPQRARRDLLEAAVQHRSDFAALRKSVFYGIVHVAPDGVYVEGQKIGQPGDIVQTIPRQDITSIAAERVDVANKALAGVGGAVGGFFAGAYLGRLMEPGCSCDDYGLKGMIVGAPIGAVLGGLAGAHAIKSREDVIYRASSPE